jgi:hypothetical protein
MIHNLIARWRLNRSLKARKAVRLVEQERARKAYWQSQRKRWANDPLRGEA